MECPHAWGWGSTGRVEELVVRWWAQPAGTRTAIFTVPFICPLYVCSIDMKVEGVEVYSFFSGALAKELVISYCFFFFPKSFPFIPFVKKWSTRSFPPVSEFWFLLKQCAKSSWLRCRSAWLFFQSGSWVHWWCQQTACPGRGGQQHCSALALDSLCSSPAVLWVSRIWAEKGWGLLRWAEVVQSYWSVISLAL